MKYDVIIIGAGPGGIFAAYELAEQDPTMRVAVIEAGHSLEKRHCPIDGVRFPTESTTSPTTSAALSTSTSERMRLCA